MIFANPVAKKEAGDIPTQDPGDFVRAVFEGAEATVGVTQTKTGIIRQGNHFAYSGFYRINSIQEYDVLLQEGTRFLDDKDLELRMYILIDENGRMVDSSGDNDILVRGKTPGDLPTDSGFFLRLIRTEVGSAEKQVNILTSEWLWVSFYLDLDTPANSRFYLNGCDVRIARVQTASDSSTATEDTTMLGYQVKKDSLSSVEAVDVGHSWLAAEVDGSVIGQPEFLNEFINPNGTAKDLGSGTVQGIVPLFYFSCATSPIFNESDGSEWIESGGAGTSLESATGIVDWYGDPKRSAVELTYRLDNNTARPRHWMFDKDIGVHNTHVFFSVFVLSASSANSRGIDLELYGQASSANHMNIRIHNYNPTGNIRVGQYLTSNSSVFRNMNVTSTVPENQWFHLCGYMDTGQTGTSWIRFNGEALIIQNTTGSASQAAVGARKMLYEEGTTTNAPALKFAHLVWYETDIIDANPGIDWLDDALWEDFIDPDGTPKDIGVYGENALGINPSGYVNPALRLGMNGIATDGNLVTLRQQYNANNGNVYLLDTRYLETDIIVSLPFRK